MSTVVYANPWFRVVQEGKYHYVDEPGGQNGAVILMREERNHILFVRHYRVALGVLSLELPRGYGEAGENSLQAAIREAYEETGYAIRPERIMQLGSVYPNSAILSTSVDLFCAEVDKSDRTGSTDGEVEELVRVPVAELRDLLRSGVLRDSFTLSALCLWMNSGEDRG